MILTPKSCVKQLQMGIMKDDFHQSALDRAEYFNNEDLVHILGQTYVESTPPGSDVRTL
jgi:hypothetical protein